MQHGIGAIVFLAVLFCGCLAASEGRSSPAPGRLRIYPPESDALIANPGMGWQTFHRFANGDANLAGLPSASAYFRFYWREVEPTEGHVDFSMLDALLADAGRSGQKLAFRIMCTGSSEYMDVPQWLKDQGCKGVEFEYRQGGGRHWVPDFDDPLFRKAHLRLIAELGQRYDGRAQLDVVDIGSVGLWGEWHMSGTRQIDTGQPVPMPPLKTRLAIIDAWRRAFRHTPVVMQVDDLEGMKYAVRKGCGWRADCLGDMGGFSPNWSHMRDAYPQAVTQTGSEDAWKVAPVAFESCWDMRKWKDEGWDIHFIFDFALRYHASYLNNKSAPIPAGTRGEIEQFLRKLGYRLVLRDVDHNSAAAPGSALEVNMTWENVGVAPPYGDYRLALRLESGEGAGRQAQIFPGRTSVKGWLPGRHPVAETILLPRRMKPGRWDLAVAIVDPRTREPAVRPANAGRAADGWLPLSRLQVEAAR